MYFEGITNIIAPREKVWKYLTDAEFVSQCAPGVKKMEVIVPDKKYQAVATVGFGSVVVEFKTVVEWQEFKVLEFAKIKAHGTAPGSAVDATSEMFLMDSVDGSTDLKWTADIVVAGNIASIASRLMGSITKKLTNMFFDCVKKQIEA